VRRALLIAVVAAFAAPACSHAASGCSGLSGSFKAVPNSEGAGNIVYTLRIHKTETGSCLLRGLPQVRLLGATGAALPTKVVRDRRFTPKPFVLRAGHTASAQARFTPDVPGPGEPTKGTSCEPVAHKLRVVAGDATVVVPVLPPTRVCVHGSMTFTPYRYATTKGALRRLRQVSGRASAYAWWWRPANAAPATVPSAFWKRKALPVVPFSEASVPAALTVPLPKNRRTVVPSVFVHAHVLPVSAGALSVFVDVAPTSESVTVAGAHESVPRSDVLVVAADQFVLSVALNVPVPSATLMAVPDAVAVVAPKLVPVPESFAMA
jgi:hypothetical protein